MAKSELRPRLWVPGVLYVSDERELRAGRHVGYNGWGKAFGFSPVGHFGSIADWRHRAWFVERAALSAELIDEHAILLAERLVDRDRQPHARRWLSEQPLVCVSGAKKERLIDAGLRVYTVEHGVEHEDWLCVEGQGGERASWLLSGRLQAFWPAEARERGQDVDGLPASESALVRTLIDRLLRWVSREVLTEIAVVNALAARALIEPGYGYRGATDGMSASIERVERDLRALEVLFAQINERAAGQRDQARAIVDALRAAEERDVEIGVPVYGQARRERLGELAIELSQSEDDALAPVWKLGRERQARLILPPESRWFVEKVSLWSPSLPSDLEQRLEAEQRKKEQQLPGWIALALVGVLVVIIALALVRL